MASLPKVAIIIPTLNEEKFIGRCLSSIMHLDYPKDKVFVVVADNMSEDRTVTIASQFQVKVISVPRKTIAYTRNIGANYATNADLLAFLDADCLVTIDWLRNITWHFSNDNVIAVGSYPSILPEESNYLQKVWSSTIRRASKGARNVDWLPSSNLVVRRKAFERVGGFDENLVTCEDADLGYRLNKIGKLIYDPSAIVYHLREPATLHELFKKERWRSKTNLAGLLAHGWSVSELPSLIFPGIFGFGLILLIVSALFSGSLVLVSTLLILLPPCIYVIKAKPKLKHVFLLFLIYMVYFFARAISFYEEIIVQLFSIFCHVIVIM